MKKLASSFISILILIIIFLSVVQVVVSNRIVTTGTMLGKLGDEVKRYKTENALLAQKVMVSASYTHIADELIQLGFVEGKSPFVLSTPLPIAQRP